MHSSSTIDHVRKNAHPFHETHRRPSNLDTGADPKEAGPNSTRLDLIVPKPPYPAALRDLKQNLTKPLIRIRLAKLRTHRLTPSSTRLVGASRGRHETSSLGITTSLKNAVLAFFRDGLLCKPHIFLRKMVAHPCAP